MAENISPGLGEKKTSLQQSLHENRVQVKDETVCFS